jgi:hypothetical protein
MTEDLTAHVYLVGEAVARYILNPAPIWLAGIALLIAGIGMLIVMTFMKDEQ